MLYFEFLGIKFYLYTGRGPSSESLHLGHLIPFHFTKVCLVLPVYRTGIKVPVIITTIIVIITTSTTNTASSITTNFFSLSKIRLPIITIIIIMTIVTTTGTASIIIAVNNKVIISQPIHPSLQFSFTRSINIFLPPAENIIIIF